MAVPIEKFVQQLEESGILAGDTVREFLPPKASPKDATELARELVRKKKLTKFQVEEVARGKGKSLVLGNYVLLDTIGAGGMGQVYKAQHRRMKRTVAIKVLPPNVTKNQAAIARFEREVEAAAKLRHPNIVAADDADCANGVHFLVMELVEGSDLSVLVRKNGPCSIENAVDYVLQAARGLEFAHKKGIVHRDIKPSNLLLDSEGTVKVLDMGLARLSGDAENPQQHDLTCTGTIMGTADYMPPEQALNTRTADARADIYALGCSLYYLLTGKAAYEGDTLMAKLLAHRDSPIPSLSAVNPQVTEQLEVLFKKMVAKKVDDRFQNMGEVIRNLETCSSQKRSSRTKLQSSTKQLDRSTATFQKILTDEPTVLAKAAPQRRDKLNPKLFYSVVGFASLGVLLGGVFVLNKTNHSRRVAEGVPPDANMPLMDALGKVDTGGKGQVATVDPGRYQVNGDNGGFNAIGRELAKSSSGEKPIQAKLVPVTERPATAGAKPASSADDQEPLFFQTPGFDQWFTQVAAMSAAQQAQAVKKKLMALNPGFDGNATHTVENGFVVELNFHTDHVTDISPVRALTALQTLSCTGSLIPPGGQGRLQDLSPLSGMRLSRLVLHNTPVSDLSPLEGMPLTTLTCPTIPVSDLSPLKGMKLVELDIQNTRVTDLSPLQNMPLERLFCRGTQVKSLLPLKGMRLTYLELGFTPVSDLSPLQGMPLTVLHCYHTSVADLSPLSGTNLKSLLFNNSQVSDVSSLKSLELTNITLTPKNISAGIDVIRQMKSLITIGLDGVSFPADQFWAKYDAGEFGKPLPANTTGGVGS